MGEKSPIGNKETTKSLLKQPRRFAKELAQAAWRREIPVSTVIAAGATWGLIYEASQVHIYNASLLLLTLAVTPLSAIGERLLAAPSYGEKLEGQEQKQNPQNGSV